MITCEDVLKMKGNAAATKAEYAAVWEHVSNCPECKNRIYTNYYEQERQGFEVSDEEVVSTLLNLADDAECNYCFSEKEKEEIERIRRSHVQENK